MVIGVEDLGLGQCMVSIDTFEESSWNGIHWTGRESIAYIIHSSGNSFLKKLQVSK